MADEFAKGLSILTGAGIVWFILATWFNTPSFEGPQLIAPNPPMDDLDLYGQLAITVKDIAFWFAIIGALTFWVVIPAVEQARNAMAE